MIALDANIVAALLRGELTELPDSDVYVPYMVIAELKAGVAAGSNPKKYGRVLAAFFGGRDVSTSNGLDETMIDAYVELYGYLKKNGTPVSPNDLWIAAECVVLGLSIYTRDKDFDYMPQVRRANLGHDDHKTGFA